MTVTVHHESAEVAELRAALRRARFETERANERAAAMQAKWQDTLAGLEVITRKSNEFADELAACHAYLDTVVPATPDVALLERITRLVAERDAAQVAAHMASYDAR